jgi:hypothetical protein
LGTKSFLISVVYNLQRGDWLQNNKEKQFVAPEKSRHKVNAEKRQHIFITCVENVEEYHTRNVSNTFLRGHNPKQ